MPAPTTLPILLVLRAISSLIWDAVGAPSCFPLVLLRPVLLCPPGGFPCTVWEEWEVEVRFPSTAVVRRSSTAGTGCCHAGVGTVNTRLLRRRSCGGGGAVPLPGSMRVGPCTRPCRPVVSSVRVSLRPRRTFTQTITDNGRRRTILRAVNGPRQRTGGYRRVETTSGPRRDKGGTWRLGVKVGGHHWRLKVQSCWNGDEDSISRQTKFDHIHPTAGLRKHVLLSSRLVAGLAASQDAWCLENYKSSPSTAARQISGAEKFLPVPGNIRGSPDDVGAHPGGHSTAGGDVRRRCWAGGGGRDKRSAGPTGGCR